MFTQPVPSTSPVGHSPTSAVNSNPTTSSRTSRLRGLSYLRNYTHNHLLSRDHSSSNGQSSNPTTSTTSQPSASRADSNALTRSVSYSNPSSPIDNNPSNRMSLVASHQEPISSSSQHSASSAANNRSTMIEPAPAEPANAAIGTQELMDAVAADASNGTSIAHSETLGDLAAAAAAAASPSTSPNDSEPALPAIRFSAYIDPRATRPSLTFSPIARTLPTGSETIRVGRYSERENLPKVPHNVPSAAPVGFKSKVVSRRHCEFFSQNGKWFIKDVKSSSGTFLNHIRLSPPGTESKPFPINDGDIVQLGIDFKGGEEMIFRCVKMRLELNRGWQSKPNAFNMNTHKRLRNMASAGDAPSTTQDCSICLNSIAPCQSLFVAPCSHTWHFKCIRSLLHTPSYPVFVCPNCRMAADLEADIEEFEEDWEQVNEEDTKPDSKAESSGARPTAAASSSASAAGPSAPLTVTNPTPATSSARAAAAVQSRSSSAAEEAAASSGATHNSDDEQGHAPNSISQPLPIRANAPSALTNGNRTPSPPGQSSNGNGNEGPITPRNDAGPWVFDGSAAGSRAGSISEPNGGMRSLDAAAEAPVDR